MNLYPEWVRRRNAHELPVQVSGGTKVSRCPDCLETFADPEDAFQHVMAGCPSAQAHAAGFDDASPR